MKSSNSILSALALAATITLSAGTAQAGTLQVPHNKQDRVIIYTYKTQYAHPIDYWWHLNPSETGSWDYFSPVSTLGQPIPVEQGTVPSYGTPTPSIRQVARKVISRKKGWRELSNQKQGAISYPVYGNPAVTGTPPAYQ